MYVKRHLEEDIFKYVRTTEVPVVVGPRQCGALSETLSAQAGKTSFRPILSISKEI